MKTLKLYISGTVQGVFFRKFIENKANELKVRGFVRNLDDGRVEVVIEGEDRNVNYMLEICKRGDLHTKIEDVEIQEIKHQGFKNFRISRL